MTTPNEPDEEVALSAAARALIATARRGDPSPAELAALRSRVLGETSGGTPPRASPSKWTWVVAAGALALLAAAFSRLAPSAAPTAPTAPISLPVPGPPPTDPVTPAAPPADVREGPTEPEPAPPDALAEEPDAEGAEPRDEAAYLESIRVLLDRNPARAARLSHRHHALFPEGLLAEEAAALEVEALARSGRGDDARAAARGFFSQYPSTPYRLRVERALTVDGESTSTE